MSKMSNVYLELCELGALRVRQIENDVNTWNVVYLEEPKRVLAEILSKYKISENTAHMIIGGAPTKTCSQAVASRSEDL